MHHSIVLIQKFLKTYLKRKQKENMVKITLKKLINSNGEIERGVEAKGGAR